MSTDTSERGLERLICMGLTGLPCDPPAEGTTEGTIAEPVTGYGVGWSAGNFHDYDREHCVDLVQLAAFLRATQPEAAEALELTRDGPTRRRFLARLQGEIAKRGTIDVLRRGVKHGARRLDLFYGTPSPGNRPAQERFERNRFTVTRQLRYSRDEAQRALDLGLFINGLPVFTFELKNSLTKQTVADAVLQYRQDRNPRERLFEFGRCVAHFAADEREVRFCTHLTGKTSWFLPFNRGWNDGAGNPPNPHGLAIEYLWREVLPRRSLTDILENYAQVVASKDAKSGRSTRTQIWPRYHQLEAVRRLLADAAANGAGRRYLIQHSAGSGKSNSIAWLAHQLIPLTRNGAPLFASIIVVTDRRILDRQIRDTIRQYAQVGATVAHAERSGDLRRFIESGKKIIISTVQKFPLILDEIGGEHRRRRFAIVIDEAHSSQGGRTSAAMTQALSEAGGTGGEGDEEETDEDRINRLMESRKLLANASYFAFTATPKHKTLEIFGAPDPQPDGAVRHHAFHGYTMKQAIQEGFILDVLAHYTPVTSYYRLAKTVADDPEFDARRAQKKLRRFVEGSDHAIRLKAEIMVDHFHDRVLARRKIGGEARAMVVTGGIERAVQYFHAIRAYLAERKSPYRALVAFSGEHEFGGARVSEASLNGLPAAQIADRFREDPYRFLVCADKFQTGYDEPLLHTMYVDKPLSGIKAVQTLSRLNRAHPGKHDVFVLDFLNDADTSAAPSRTTTAPRSWPTRPTPTGCTICRPTWTAPRSIPTSRSKSSCGATWTAPAASASIRSSTPAWRSTGASWTKTGRSRSRATPRASSAPTAFCRPSCRTPTPAGRSARSSSTSWCPSCPRPRRRTWPRASSTPSTWTATGSRSRRCSGSCCRTGTRRSTRCRPPAAAAGPNRNWSGCPTSCAPSTSTSATSTGKTPTGCGNSSSRRYPPAWPRTPPSATRSAIPTARTPASSTTGRCCG